MKNDSPILLHIPHASVHIPKEERSRFCLPDLDEELIQMTDRYCDELFAGYDGVVFPVSRLVCDPERFRDDAQESMSRIGMGAVYTKSSSGEPLRRITAEEREGLLRRYYDPHHRRLTAAVDAKLQTYGRCLIVDGHSFHPAPLSYELDIAKLGLRLGETGDAVTLTGIADRVDGWEQDGRLWLRVADYKTGHKKFSFSDLVYGRNMQMLLYLFALCDRAEALYGRPAEPAGILYVPARDDLLHFDANPETADAEKERKKGKRRSGIVLYDQAVMQAWEQAAEGESVYRPVKTRTSDPEITAEQFDMLRTYVADRLRAMGDEIRSGAIEACPAWTSETENACARCDYLSVCGFSEGENGDRYFPTPKLDDRDAWDVIAGGGDLAPQEGGLS